MSRKITPIPYTLLIKIFEAEGFSIVRRKGDHIIMTKTGVKRPLVIKLNWNGWEERVMGNG